MGALCFWCRPQKDKMRNYKSEALQGQPREREDLEKQLTQSLAPYRYSKTTLRDPPPRSPEHGAWPGGLLSRVSGIGAVWLVLTLPPGSSPGGPLIWAGARTWPSIRGLCVISLRWCWVPQPSAVPLVGVGSRRLLLLPFLLSGWGSLAPPSGPAISFRNWRLAKC